MLSLIGLFEIFCLVADNISCDSGCLTVDDVRIDAFNLGRFDNSLGCRVSLIAISQKTVVYRLLLFNPKHFAGHVIKVAIFARETLNFIHVKINDFSTFLHCFVLFIRVLL